MNPSRASSGTLVRRRSKLSGRPAVRLHVMAPHCALYSYLWSFFFETVPEHRIEFQVIICSLNVKVSAIRACSWLKRPWQWHQGHFPLCMSFDASFGFSSSSWRWLVSSLVYRLHRPQRFHGVNLIVQSSLMFVVSAAWLSRQKKI